MIKITLPKPCYKGWENMTPNEQGRLCHSCTTTVIDFTNMSDDEIKYFLLAKKEEKVCGRFKDEQLYYNTIKLPENILQQQLPWWKCFLLASLIAFSTMLFSCTTTSDKKNNQPDPAHDEGVRTGMPAMIDTSAKDSTPNKTDIKKP